VGTVSAASTGAPEKLSRDHELTGFESGEVALDNWLKKRAWQNEGNGASRTYVVSAGKRVAGYYSLATGAVSHAASPGRMRRNMPDPIPVMILGRLAVDKSFQGQGVGKGLLRDAILRTAQAAGIAGIRGLLFHAISDDAKKFYEACGFIASPIDPMTLVITVAEAAAILTAAGRGRDRRR
jgi:GNAT superfamily N-acetyltransferase